MNMMTAFLDILSRYTGVAHRLISLPIGLLQVSHSTETINQEVVPASSGVLDAMQYLQTSSIIEVRVIVMRTQVLLRVCAVAVHLLIGERPHLSEEGLLNREQMLDGHFCAFLCRRHVLDEGYPVFDQTFNYRFCSLFVIQIV